MSEWLRWDGKGTPPSFDETDRVQTKTRDGRTCGPEGEPWMFSGWIHTGGANDIVAYRLVK